MNEKKLEIFSLNELQRRLTEMEEDVVIIRWFDYGERSSLFSENIRNNRSYSIIQNKHICEFAKTYSQVVIYHKEYNPVPQSIATINLNMQNTIVDIDMSKVNTFIDVIIFNNDVSISDRKLLINICQRNHFDSYKLKLNIDPDDMSGSSILNLFDAVFEKMKIILKNDYSNYLMRL